MAFKKINISKDVIIALLAVSTIISTGAFLKRDIEFESQVFKTKEATERLSLSESNNKALTKNIKEQEKAIKELNDEVADLKTKNTSKDATISELRQKVGDLQPKELPTKGVATSRGSNTRGTQMTLRLSFYGDGAEENGGYAGIDAQGNKLVAGTIASNVYPMGTQFMINGQVYTVRDRGGSHFDSADRIDVFVPRLNGETKEEYNRRIMNYGRKEVTATKLS